MRLHRRGLTGKGVWVGIWDENVDPHPDFCNWVKIEEFAKPSQQGADPHGNMARLTVSRLAGLGGRALRAATSRAAHAGRHGPDFQYGHGVVNAERAVQALEKRCHTAASITHGKEISKQISIPAGATGLRVMLVWDDELSLAAMEQPAEKRKLVHDLDLSIVAGGNTYQPWVLAPSDVEALAMRKRDGLIQHGAGYAIRRGVGANSTVEVKIKGEEIPSEDVPFALVWWLETAE